MSNKIHKENCLSKIICPHPAYRYLSFPYPCDCEEAKKEVALLAIPSSKEPNHSHPQDFNGKCYECGVDKASQAKKCKDNEHCECDGKDVCRNAEKFDQPKEWEVKLTDFIMINDLYQRGLPIGKLTAFISSLLAAQRAELLEEFLNQKANNHDQEVRRQVLDTLEKEIKNDKNIKGFMKIHLYSLIKKLK